MAERPFMLFAGFGYCAKALAPKLAARGFRLAGTIRDEAKAAALSEAGVEPVLWPPSAALAREATHILISAAPDEGGTRHWAHLAGR